VSASGAATLTQRELGAIATVMREAGVDVGRLTADLIAGGRSNLTFLLGDGTGQQWVMRTPPRAGRTPSAHDVAREFRVTAALGATDVPVARAVALCEDESIIGGAFAIADFVRGRTVQTRHTLAELDDTAVEGVVRALVSTLARLHRVDHVAVGLERFGRPDAYAERQLRRWSGQWGLVGADEVRPLATEVIAGLERRVPPQRSTGIVHGDYRIDNTILDEDLTRPRIAAVVDWELSTIGDPVADVAMMCAYRDRAFDLIVGEPSAWTSERLPDAAALAAMYEAGGGVPLEHWEFHLALAYFKIGVIAAGIDHRQRSGGPAGTGFDTAGASVPVYLELARATLGRGR
jgi:aminoglycoside phosphotransferase (APT) family kinase protein